MRDLLHGRTITVRPVVFGDDDAFGNPEKSYGDPVEIKNVLIAPGDPMAAIEDGRPYGASIAYDLCIPKGVEVVFRGAIVEIDDEAFDVVGDPRPYPDELTPGGWGMEVKVIRHV